MGFMAAVIVDHAKLAARGKPALRRFALVMLFYLIPKVKQYLVYLRTNGPQHFNGFSRATLQVALLFIDSAEDVIVGL